MQSVIYVRSAVLPRPQTHTYSLAAIALTTGASFALHYSSLCRKISHPPHFRLFDQTYAQAPFSPPFIGYITKNLLQSTRRP